MAGKSIIIGEYRCMYPTLSTPKAFTGQPEDKAKFKIVLLIPKSDKTGYKQLLDFITKSIDECGDWKAEVKKQVLATAKKTIGEEGANNNCILRDGDELNKQYLAEDKKPVEAYAGHYVISVNRPAKWGAPLCVGKDAKEIPGSLVDSVIRPGYWVKAEISAYCYKKPKNGITLQLGGVQMWRKDEEFGRQNNFTAGEVDEDDESSFSE